MPSQSLVIHERTGAWARCLRPRLSGRHVRVVETRTAIDLVQALGGMACPILVIDLTRRPRAGLEDLCEALHHAPDALSLVLDPDAHPGVAVLARELGASHVISGPAPPPSVAGLLARWLRLAQKRAETAGWFATAPEPPEPEPWSWLTPLLNSWTGTQRPARI